jgi:hypothetical protein
MISVEIMNKPTVMLTNDGFYTDGRQAASTKGFPGLRLVQETVPCECSVMEDAEAGVNQVFDQIIDALTKPLTPEEASPKAKEKEKPARIAFKGNLEEINRFFYKRGWSDGLPLIPPTEATVREMLSGTDLPPDHILGVIEPRLGKATVEKVAVNAVMAGALTCAHAGSYCVRAGHAGPQFMVWYIQHEHRFMGAMLDYQWPDPEGCPLQ